ncbi:MAG: transcription-repair coupling factor [Deltaproteobacteria bacterium]|nr:transcription-repair coupling factor [Deltaproteobacteria bacterium]
MRPGDMVRLPKEESLEKRRTGMNEGKLNVEQPAWLRNGSIGTHVNLSGDSIADLIEKVRRADGRIDCTGLSGAEQAYLLYRLRAELKRPLFVLCAKGKNAELLAADIRFFSTKSDIPIIAFPSYDILPFKPLSYHPETSCRRVEALYQTMTLTQPPIIITSVAAVLQKVMPKAILSRFAEYLLPGEEIDRDGLVQKLIHGGYQNAVLVEEPGDFAIRGSLIDVFPPLYPNPVRIEFFGDIIESLRTFSAQDQRSLKKLSEVTLLPASEVIIEPGELDNISRRIRTRGQALEMPGTRIEEIVEKLTRQNRFPGIGGLLPLVYPSLNTLFDYLPKDTIPVLIDPATIEKIALETEETVTKNYFWAKNEGNLCVEPEVLYLNRSQVEASIAGGLHLAFKMVPMTGRAGTACNFTIEKNDLIAEQIKSRRHSEELLKPLSDWVNNNLHEGLAPYLLCRTTKQAQRLKGLIMPYGIHIDIIESFPSDNGAKNTLSICLGELSSGFVWPREALAIITEDELFGPKHRLPKVPRKEYTTEPLGFHDLKAGDLVVHREHGIGQYEGLVRLDVADITNDFLLIGYRGGDKLYVPVDRMNCVQKYVGVDGVEPRLDKMGGKSWARAKSRIKKSIQKMAGELLKLYSWRQVRKGHAFSPPDRYFREFEAGFEYRETPDQTRAIEEVLADMESPVPMDRLICGDVGYGKTEIALRAAFKAVWDNKQVAFLVPTTVLARQHFETFRKRLEPYPVVVETLSRFSSQSEQRQVVEKLKKGQVDIVIGTHRLLQKDVGFKDLGLLIIDEEQRFGVSHKERLKQLRRSVDVLALTATPIPRTLHMSLMGIRDLSVIATPPEYRYPIKTYICPFDDTVVAEAIERELQRGGQIFYVHNNIRTIWGVARHIQALVPHVRVGVAHGRLSDEELEKVMLQFLDRKIDLLVCTTIIESGLDFPTANTILINRADKFGLSQIYQLRGRVGRGDEQAYAYLFIPHESALTRDAQKRLKVLMEHSDLGSGFKIAMSDLQIRGGGTILGPSQSGHIASVGYDMYIELIKRAVSELKGEAVEVEVQPEVVVNRSAYIPETYIPDTDQRLLAYRRLARITDEAEIEDFSMEMQDRYGQLPEPARNLLEKVTLTVLSKKIGIQRLELTNGHLRLTFSEKTHVKPEKITSLIQRDPQRFRLTANYVLHAKILPDAHITSMNVAKNILQELT